MLVRYGSLEYLKACELQDGKELIEYAIKTTREEKLHQQWLMGGYNMSISFDEFKKQNETNADNRTAEQVLFETEKLFNDWGG